MDPGNPGEPSELLASAPPIPMTLGEAIAAYTADDYLMDTMPEELTRIYTQLKQDEWARYCGEITQWEFDQYWEAIP